MKKIFRLLLLGFLTVTALSPSIVTAAEDQAVQEPKSSVYTQIDEIAPLATPFIHEVTLDHGESYTILRDMIFTPDNEWGIGAPWYLIKVATLTGDKETFCLEFLNNIPNSGLAGAKEYYHDNHFTYKLYVYDYTPEEIDIRYFGYKITNYSAGPVTYRIGLNITYGSDDGLEFDLFN